MNTSGTTLDRPRRLFRFFNPPGAEFLQNRRLWFRRICDLNDPFDGVPALGTMVRRAKSYWTNQMLRDGFLTNESHAELERRSKEAEDKVHENFSIGARSLFAIVSFTASLNRIPFWSYYAQDHKGFAVEFNPRHKFFDKLVRVEYTNHRPPIRGIDDADSRLFDLIRTKSKDWEDEDEWRLPAMLQNLTEDNGPEGTGFTHYLKVPAEAIRAVFLGCRADSTLTTRIGSILKHRKLSKIRCFEMKPDLDYYKLNPVPVIW